MGSKYNAKAYRYAGPGIILLALIFISISIRLFYLQIGCFDYFYRKSTQNFLRYQSTKPLRGTIFDRNGVPLAANKPVFHVWWQGTGKRSMTEEQKRLIALLDSAIPSSGTKSVLEQKIMRCERKGTQFCIATQVPLSIIVQLEERFGLSPNLVIMTDSERCYPQGSTAAHVIGYLSGATGSNKDSGGGEGKMGLEKVLHQSLTGIDGVTQRTVTSTGANLHDIKLALAQEGASVRTTIDIRLQKICESIFPSTHAGAMIIMDPEEGDILSLVSYPSYNPALFSAPLSVATWDDSFHRQNCSFLNRACNALYPPGSLFKLVVISAALEKGIIEPHDTITCTGSISFGGRVYRCHKKSGHGTINVEEALAQSCNVLFYKIAQHADLPIDTIASYAYRFGLGVPTGIILPEKSGLIPTTAWKFVAKDERWWPGESLAVAIGQSYLLVTPLQISRMVASIFTGFIIKPRLLLGEPSIKNLIDVLPETRTLLRRSMRSVVRQGTGRLVQAVKDITIYAKTGTAQTSSLDKKKMMEHDKEHGWLVAYIQYKNERPLILTILIEHGESSKIAIHTARNFVLEYTRMINSCCD